MKKDTITMRKDMAMCFDAFDEDEFMKHMEKTRQAEHLAAEAVKSEWRYFAYRLGKAVWFENFMGLVIVLNMIAMIIEIDRSASEPAEVSKKIHWTDVCGSIALVLFIIDMAVRLTALRGTFWKDTSNIFDFIIVVADVCCTLVDLIAGSRFPVSTLRIFRLAKLARVSKVVRVFPELRLLIAGLMSSISAIFWGTVLLAFWLLVWAMIAVLFLHPLNVEVDYGDDCERCPRAYSSVAQATLTLWQQLVTGDSWGSATIPLIEQYPHTLLVFVPAFLSIGMAVMNLILGVVVSAAQTAKERLEREEHADKALNKLERQSHLYEMCRDMDKDSSGELSYDEILNSFQKEGELRDLFVSLDISTQDFNVAWTIMDADDSNSVSYKEFVSSLCKMKNSDIQFLLAYIKFYVTMIKNELLDSFRSMQNKVLMEDVVLQSQAFETGLESGGCVTASNEKSNLEANAEDTNQLSPIPATVSSTANAPVSGATTALLHDEMQTWISKVCSEIDTLRAELIGELVDIDRKFCTGGSIVSRSHQEEPGLSSASRKNNSFKLLNTCCESSVLEEKPPMMQSFPVMRPQSEVSPPPLPQAVSSIKRHDL